jgi:hypothetical protein
VAASSVVALVEEQNRDRRAELNVLVDLGRKRIAAALLILQVDRWKEQGGVQRELKLVDCCCFLRETRGKKKDYCGLHLGERKRVEGEAGLGLRQRESGGGLGESIRERSEEGYLRELVRVRLGGLLDGLNDLGRNILSREIYR